MKSLPPKITVDHLRRQAMVYIRQSSMRQVRDNLESQRLQYALADRARKLGWQDVEIIDADLGVSAAAGSARSGFERLVASVALGDVGIVLSREVSRLSRNDKDWCHLMEVCQAFETLIGDEDQIYDLDLMDDQLILGIKGTMSVVELKVLKKRMLQGRDEKARRGEYFTRLPPGYVLDGTGKQVVFDPDERVQNAIAQIFRKFRELWSARATCHWFRNESIKLPVNECSGGTVRIAWKLPQPSFIQDVLSNPFYAGAYTFGRGFTRVEFKNGQLVKRRTRPRRRPEECQVFIRDHHVGYIDWRTYEENRERMSRNNPSAEPDSRLAAVRAGQGLLTGLLRCAHCGHKLHVRYWGRRGTNARYFCSGDYNLGGNYCVAFGGGTVDRHLSQEILRVISPLGIEASLEAQERIQAAETEQQKSLRLELQQLDYEVQRAREQYDEVDPRNRLVAAELECRWNEKLEERDALCGRIAALEAGPQPLSADDEQRLRALGRSFACVWEDESCPVDLKKKIAHTLIEEIVVRVEDETLHMIIHWMGGSHTQFEMPKPKSPFGKKNPPEAIKIIRGLAVRYGDDQIASVLNKLGHRTGKDLRWTALRVASARRRSSIPGQRATRPDPEILSQAEAVKYCSVPPSVLRRLVEDGLLKNNQEIPLAPWELKRAELDSEPVQRVLQHYKKTGKYPKEGGYSTGQMILTD